MRVVALISGGKDSCYNMIQCVLAGHEVVALANLRPKNKDEVDSYMYQSVGHDALDLYATSMELPLFRCDIEGKPVNKDFEYKPTEGDEVEDLYNLLEDIKKKVDFDAVSVGAIYSDYQRLRVQNVCDRLDLKMLSYLWHRDQAELLQEMITADVKAIIIKVAAMGLDPMKHLGMSIEEIYPHMLEMNKKYGLNICGEGGEFETFTLNCPLFKKELVVLDKEIVIHSNDAFAPVGYLKLNKVSLKNKNTDQNLTQKECVSCVAEKLSKRIEVEA